MSECWLWSGRRDEIPSALVCAKVPSPPTQTLVSQVANDQFLFEPQWLPLTSAEAETTKMGDRGGQNKHLAIRSPCAPHQQKVGMSPIQCQRRAGQSVPAHRTMTAHMGARAGGTPVLAATNTDHPKYSAHKSLSGLPHYCPHVLCSHSNPTMTTQSLGWAHTSMTCQEPCLFSSLPRAVVGPSMWPVPGPVPSVSPQGSASFHSPST